MNAKVYMNVPYSEKDSAKSLGASWDAVVKKWYYDGPVNGISKFGKWILNGKEQAIVAYETFHIIEGVRTCYSCHKETRVIGFGIGEHSILSEDNGEYFIEDPDDYPESEDEIHLAWTDDEKKIPPLLLNYIKDHYHVKMGISGVVGACFANHCDHCDGIQGNHYLFEEESALSTATPDEKELMQRMSKLKMYNIYTDAALVLDWDMSYCSNDWAYTHYCKGFEDIILSADPDDMWTPYPELYMIKGLKP